ncbi:MAG: PEP-utilizing enzyme [Desulfobacterales bacterium]|nr:PEP-utilizing enzyme [Desulfobacterales bacterium]
MNSHRYVVDFLSKEHASVQNIGGKGSNLARMTAMGINIPPGYAITTQCMADVFKKNHIFERVSENLATLSPDSARESIEKCARVIKKEIENLEIPSDVTGMILEKHHRIIAGSYFSVRSSAVDEDRSGASFAGLHDSFLFIKSESDLILKIKAAWASLFNTRALSFRLQHQITLQNIKIAVIIQKMVSAYKSGIIFTANPNTHNINEILISCLYGAGEGIVSAGLDADLFTVSKENHGHTTAIASKTEQLVFDENAGTGLKTVAVSSSLQDKPCLAEFEISELAKISTDLENSYGKPQDIEFSIDKNSTIFILQSRPITTLHEYGPAAGNRIVWDNSNIIESYSGPTTPLTFSFIRHAYTIVYHCFAGVMGISSKKVHESRYIFENMLGLINGRVYYNIINWYKLVQLFPGFHYNKTFMESMMGIREKITIDDDDSKAGFFQKYFVELPKLLFLVGRSVYNFSRMKKLVKAFDDNFNLHYSHWEHMDFNRMPPKDLMQIYREMESALLWNWKTPIINDFYVMIFYGLLKHVCEKWYGDESGSLQNDLICGEGNIESTQPTKLLMEITRLVKQDKQFVKTFESLTPEALVTLVRSAPKYHEISKKIDHYLKEYGFRCINELKLEEPSLKETPQFLFQIIQNYLKMDNEDALNPELMEQKEKHIRQQAEQKVNQHLSGTRLAAVKKRMFSWILNSARNGVKNRENMRFARTKIYGLVREMFNAVGRHFEHEGIIETQSDIYYLSVDEIWDFINGTAISTDFKALINLRKKEFKSYNSSETDSPDDHFETFGMVYHKNRFKNTKVDTSSQRTDGLKGIGCSPGKVTKPVKIVKSPTDDLTINGEILVAGRTDPGWVPLYPSVSGILIERGSILSHSAIVAREMGIPTIVGIPNLLNVLKDDQVVTMDGSTGELDIEP